MMIDQEVSYDFGVSQIIQVMDEHDLVLKAMVTWGSIILRQPQIRVINGI